MASTTTAEWRSLRCMAATPASTAWQHARRFIGSVPATDMER